MVVLAQGASLSVHEVSEIAGHLMAAKMYSLASCVMLFYDIFITLGDEVEKVWSQKLTIATFLWFMNRYISPLGYIVVIVSFHDPNWSKTTCNRYVLYPEALKIVTAAIIGVIFILRLYSIYGSSMIVLGLILGLLLVELGIKIWAFTDGTSVDLPPGLVGCILTGRDNSNSRFVFTWVAELIFDTTIFIATLFRTVIIYHRHRRGAATPLIKIMMRDGKFPGIIYFGTIFAANIVTVTLFLVLPDDLKAVNASFSTLITSLMVSRLILNLRSQILTSSTHSFDTATCSGAHAKILISSTVVGNLGQPVSCWFDGEDDYDSMCKSALDGGDIIIRGLETAIPAAIPHNAVQGLHRPDILVSVTHNVSNDTDVSPAPLPYHLDSAYSPEPEDSHEPKPPVTKVDFESSRENTPRCKALVSCGTIRRPSSARSRACGEDRSGVWLPPRTWRLDENIPLSSLGKTRHSLSE